MRSFAELYARAAARKGGAKALEALIPKPKSKAVLSRIPDDRWLSEMTRSVFQAGFVWRVVENKWPDFEHAFRGFDPHAVAYLSDEDVERLARDPKIIRHHKKILAARENATFILDLAAEHGSAATFFAASPARGYAGLLEVLKKRASRVGGTSAQYFLRRMGKDSFVLIAL
jgi:3-methyladenine DNA glycosylase Tag